MNTHAPLARRVSREEFQQVLQRAGFGFGAGLAFRYDARHNETVWTINGQPLGLTVGRIGATTACFLATPATCMDAARLDQPAEPPMVAVPLISNIEPRTCERTTGSRPLK